MRKIYVIVLSASCLVVIMVWIKYRDGIEYLTPVSHLLCAVNRSCNERFDKCKYRTKIYKLYQCYPELFLQVIEIFMKNQLLLLPMNQLLIILIITIHLIPQLTQQKIPHNQEIRLRISPSKCKRVVL